MLGGFGGSLLNDFPNVLAEMDSSLPLCERVKVNKRRRSATNDKPKYAEVSSNEDNDSEACKFIMNNIFFKVLFTLFSQVFLLLVM